MVVRLAGSRSSVMATQALTADRDVLMEQARIPTGVATPVATVAVANHHTGQRFVGNVVHCGSIGRWVGTAVAGRTLIGNHRLSVIPAAGPPGRNAVTVCAVRRRRNVGSGLPTGTAPVVTTGAVGRCGESAVIRSGARPIDCRLVAAIASGLRLQVSR